MKMNFATKYTLFAAALVTVVGFNACKKSKSAEPLPIIDPVYTEINTKQTPTINRAELTNDSIFLYAKEIYYWNTSLPTYDAYEPRKYGAGEANYELNLYNLVKASKSADYVSAATPPNNKYSYIFNTDDANPNPTANIPNASASVDLEGNGNDMGIYNLSALRVGTTNVYKLYILATAENSPSFNAGLTRGAYITSINGTPIGNIVSDKIAAAEVNLINSTIFSDPATLRLTGFKADGSAFNVTIIKASYKSSPILKKSVLTAGAKKIGYLAYARFSNKENSEQVLTDAFNEFATKNVTDLIIDLRYNGGGYVSTAEHLINLIAPSSSSGVMYTEHFNNNLKNRKRTDPSILSNQPLLDDKGKLQYENGKMVTYADIDYSVAGNTNNFSKKGNLTGISNVVFIVSGNTASASELVINSLKPHVNVKLVGTKTYGKPIGFFPVTIEKKYEVYLSLFETKNSLGQGEYYSGFVPDVDGGTDYGDFDFGNPQESYLLKAIQVLVPNATPFNVISATKGVSANVAKSSQLNLLGEIGNKEEFKGMIENRHKTK